MERATITHPEIVTFKMLAKPARKGMKAAHEAAYWFSNAANVFEVIYSGLNSGHFRGDEHRISSLAEVCAFAFRTLAETQGEDLQRLAMDMGFHPGAPEEAEAPETKGDAA